MPIITEIKSLARGPRANIYLDGAFGFVLGAESIAAHGLKAGTSVSLEEVEALLAEDLRRSIRDAAWRLLAYRARSRRELRERLLRKGYEEPAVEAELDRLQDLGYLDDGAFARSWVASRQASPRPLGPAAVRGELRRKGIDAEVVADALEQGDEGELALRAASKHAHTVATLAHREFGRKLLAYLQRRGFDYEVARKAVDTLWEQLHGAADDEPEAL